MATWLALARELAADLAAAGVDTSESDARRIVETVTGAEGAEYHRVLDESATARAVAELDRLAARRAGGEPLQYVLGGWGFRTLDLFVDRRVLIPRPETEVVAGLAMAEVDRLGVERPIVVDLGTGSGAIALSIAAERPSCEVWATDRSGDALAVARANLAGTGRAATRVRLCEGSWYDALPADLIESVAVIVSNPPYVAADETLPAVVADWEPAEALVAGPTGMEDVVAVLDRAPHWLVPGGAVVVEMAPDQTAAAAAHAERLGLREVQVRQDLAGRDRAVVARRAS